MPFVQGQLSGEALWGLVTTQCAHCGEPLHIEMDSTLGYHVVEKGAEPLYFAPLTGIKPGDPSIINGF